MRRLTCITAITLFAALALPVSLAAQQTRYKIIDLGTLGGPNSYPSGLNNRGQVIAYAETAVPDPNGKDGITNGWVWHAIRADHGVVTDLGTPPGVDSTVNASIPLWISDNGLVAGLSENGLIDPLTGFPQVRAVLWDGGNGIDLGTLGGNSSQAFGVNSRRQVVGVALNDTPDDFSKFMNFLPAATQARAFLWQDGSMHDLGTLGGPDASALVVNEHGQVAGFSFTDSSPNATTRMPTVHPFLWENGTMHDLGSLGGTRALPGAYFALPFGVGVLNSRGQVVGTSTLAGDKNQHAFLWEGGVMKDLGTLGGNNSLALFISETGDVVGLAQLENAIYHAFLWRNGEMTDLGTLDPCRLTSSAHSVNSNGQVVGDAACPNAGKPPTFRAFLSEHGQPMVDLNNLVLPGSDLTVNSTSFINDRGEIAGDATLPNGDVRAVMLVPASAEEIAAAMTAAQISQKRAVQRPVFSR